MQRQVIEINSPEEKIPGHEGPEEIYELTKEV